MYKVLNQEGERIVVKEINPQIHRHLSGREFNEDDACVKAPKIQTRDYTPDTIVWVVNTETSEVTITEEMYREQAIEAYKEKYGRKPSHLMKTENIIAKL